MTHENEGHLEIEDRGAVLIRSAATAADHTQTHKEQPS